MPQTLFLFLFLLLAAALVSAAPRLGRAVRAAVCAARTESDLAEAPSPASSAVPTSLRAGISPQQVAALGRTLIQATPSPVRCLHRRSARVLYAPRWSQL